VVRNLPQVGVSVTLTDGPQWVVYNGNPLSTDTSGQVLFQVSCQAAGSQAISVAVGSGAAMALQLPDCVPPPTTTLPPSTTAPPPSTTTTTTCPPTPTSRRTTTTSLPGAC
jgi:hypothetical protein